MEEVSGGRTIQGWTTTMYRYGPVIKWGSIVLIAASLLLIFRQLPVGPGVQMLEAWIESLGIWGPLVFGLVYVAAVVFMMPGSALTMVAGALFGQVGGTVVASLASTTGAALAFLTSRYLARDRIAVSLQQHLKFGAIDRAIAESGWKIVALLRVSPAVPFNIQNYLYGLTGIRFWTCAITSWLAMLPGTFLYVYLGHIGRASIEAASGGAERALSPVEWAMPIVGLFATIAVTLYITYLARKALRQHTGIARTEEPRSDSQVGQVQPKGWPWGVTLTAGLALAAMTAAGYAQFNPDMFKRLIGSLLGPPQATLHETYEEKPGGPTFDHSTFDALLKSHVDRVGGVDYRGLAADAAKLDAYLLALANAPFNEMGRNQKLALLINCYNAATLRLILDYHPVESIKDIPADKRWDDVRWQVGSHVWSLSQIENEQIRPKFKEPRIHFALVCAAVGCPKLRNEAYHADRIDEQLDDQARYVHSNGRWLQFEPEKDVVRLTRLFLWYRGDFQQVAGSVLKFAARYAPGLRHLLDSAHKLRIEWLPYDWSLNSKENVG